MKQGKDSADVPARATPPVLHGHGAACLALLAAAPRACPAGGLPPANLSVSPLEGPELPVLLVLVGCLVIGLALGAGRARTRTRLPPSQDATPPPAAPLAPAQARPSPSPPVAGWLIAIDGPPVRHAIEALPFRIGRAMANDLVLTDPSVSRFHAEVDLRQDGAIAITDLDSLNGVFIGGKRISQSRLFDGCRLEIGDVAFRYTLEPPAVAAGGTLAFTLRRRRRS